MILPQPVILLGDEPHLTIRLSLQLGHIAVTARGVLLADVADTCCGMASLVQKPGNGNLPALAVGLAPIGNEKFADMEKICVGCSLFRQQPEPEPDNNG